MHAANTSVEALCWHSRHSVGRKGAPKVALLSCALSLRAVASAFHGNIGVHNSCDGPIWSPEPVALPQAPPSMMSDKFVGVFMHPNVYLASFSAVPVDINVLDYPCCG